MGSPGGSLQRRLEALEAQTIPAIGEWPDWPLEDQLENAFNSLRAHRCGGTRQLATDRQIHCMGLLCALWELKGGVGEYVFPSGVVVSWSAPDDEGMQSVDASGRIGLEDLPEGVREYWERWPPAEQPERDRQLYELWRDEQDRGEDTS